MKLDLNQSFLKTWLSSKALELHDGLLLAGWRGDLDYFKTRVRKGEDLSLSDSHGWMALHLAVWNMPAAVVIFLLDTVHHKKLK
jgi:hypothetical protein